MATNRKPVFGYFSGKLGLTYGRMVHGVNLVNSMPSTKSNPRTALQMDNRERFKTLAQLSSAFLATSKIGLKNKAKAFGPLVSVFDAFIKVNQEAVSVMGGEAEVDYGSLKCSLGNLPQFGYGNAGFTEPGRVTVAWNTSAAEPGADAEDKGYIFIYQPDTNRGILSAPALRTTGTATVTVPTSWTGLPVQVYGFAIGAGRDNKGNTCDSTYIGTGTIG